MIEITTLIIKIKQKTPPEQQAGLRYVKTNLRK